MNIYNDTVRDVQRLHDLNEKLTYMTAKNVELKEERKQIIRRLRNKGLKYDDLQKFR